MTSFVSKLAQDVIENLNLTNDGTDPELETDKFETMELMNFHEMREILMTSLIEQVSPKMVQNQNEAYKHSTYSLTNISHR